MIGRLFSQASSRISLAIISFGLVLGIIWQYLFFGHSFGLSYPLFIILFVAGLYAFLLYASDRKKGSAPWLLLPILFFSFMVFVRDTPELKLLDVLISIYALMLLTHTIISTKKFWNRSLVDFARVLLVPFRYIDQYTKLFSNIKPGEVPSESKQRLSAVIRGAAITVPIFIVFVALFASADMGFSNVLQHLFYWDFSFDKSIVWRIVLSLLSALFIGGSYAYALYHRESEVADKPASTEEKKIKNRSIEVSILLVSLNVLFFFFIVVQFTYLFGGTDVIASLGLTYAEYARHGFFELVTASILTFAIIWACDFGLRQSGQRHNYLFRTISSLLIVQTLLIMVSAFYRLALYEQAYGFTLSRIYAHVTIIWLGIVMIFLAYKILTHATQRVFVAGFTISALVIIGCLNLANPEHIVVNQNINRFHETGKLDVDYLSGLSADGMVPLIDAYADDSGLNVTTPTGNELSQMLEARNNDLYVDPSATRQYFDWRSLTLSRIRILIEKGND